MSPRFAIETDCHFFVLRRASFFARPQRRASAIFVGRRISTCLKQYVVVVGSRGSGGESSGGGRRGEKGHVVNGSGWLRPLLLLAERRTCYTLRGELRWYVGIDTGRWGIVVVGLLLLRRRMRRLGRLGGGVVILMRRLRRVLLLRRDRIRRRLAGECRRLIVRLSRTVHLLWMAIRRRRLVRHDNEKALVSTADFSPPSIVLSCCRPPEDCLGRKREKGFWWVIEWRVSFRVDMYRFFRARIETSPSTTGRPRKGQAAKAVGAWLSNEAMAFKLQITFLSFPHH